MMKTQYGNLAVDAKKYQNIAKRIEDKFSFLVNV